MANVHTRLELHRRRLQGPNVNVSDYSNIPSAHRQDVMGASAAAVGGASDTGSGCASVAVLNSARSFSQSESEQTNQHPLLALEAELTALGGSRSEVVSDT